MVVKDKNKPGIDELRRKVLPILKQHGVASASVFGSFSTGKIRKTSDLDLLIEFEGEKSLFDLVALKLDLEASINRKVDVLTYRSLNPLLRERILEQSVRLV